MDFLDFLGADAPAAGAVESDSDDDEGVASSSPSAPSSLALSLARLRQNINRDADGVVSSSPSAPSALALSLARLRQNINRDAVEQLDKQGFVVMDNVFEQTLVGRFASEINALHAAGHTGLNSTAFVSAHVDGERPSIARLIPKPGVFETELTQAVRKDVGHLMPELVSLYSALPGIEAHLASLLPKLSLSVGQERSSIKLQYNRGGAGPGRAFPFHFDSPGGSKDSRRLTMLLYLNPGWKRGDGGELVLQPFLTPAVRVAPKAGRMVLFKSDALLHRVEPSTAERRCLTIWLHCKPEAAPAASTAAAASGSSAAAAAASTASSSASSASAGASAAAASSASSPSSPSASDPDAFAALWMGRMQDPVWQRVLARAVYLDEWRQSFIQAHGTAADTDAEGEDGRDPKDAASPAARAAAAPAAVCYVSGGATTTAGADAAAAAAAGADATVRGAEPLVASLESDAMRVESELAGTGILELMRSVAEQNKGKTIDV